MDAPTTKTRSQKKTRLLGCLTAIVSLLALSGLLVVWGHYERQRSRAEFERHRQRFQETEFARIKSGDSQATVYGPELILMLTSDAQCIKNVTFLYFFMTDLSDARYSSTRRLVNVRGIGFYDCTSADILLEAIAGMPSIESLSFEGTGVSNSGIHSFATFPNLRITRFQDVMEQRTIDLVKETVPRVNIEAPYRAEEARK
jgi:hypothetical protein